MLGKNCARALPTLAVAEASCASCRRMSGRCVSNSDGRPGVTRGIAIWLSEPPATRTLSGGRDTSVASALMFWSSVCRSGGTSALWLASTLSCWATSRSVPVPAFSAAGWRRGCAAALAILRCGGADPVLRRQHLEIGVGDAGQRGQRHHVAIEAVGDGGLLRRLRGIAVLAPEIELVARAERGLIVDDLAAAIGQAAGARARGARIGLRPVPLRLGSSAAPAIRACASAWMKRATAAAISRLTVCASSISAVSSARTKAAPPVERRRRVVRSSSAGGLVAVGNIERGVGKVLGQDAARRARDEAKHSDRARQARAAGTMRPPASGRSPRN